MYTPLKPLELCMDSLLVYYEGISFCKEHGDLLMLKCWSKIAYLYTETQCFAHSGQLQQICCT